MSYVTLTAITPIHAQTKFAQKPLKSNQNSLPILPFLFVLFHKKSKYVLFFLYYSWRIHTSVNYDIHYICVINFFYLALSSLTYYFFTCCFWLMFFFLPLFNWGNHYFSAVTFISFISLNYNFCTKIIFPKRLVYESSWALFQLLKPLFCITTL